MSSPLLLNKPLACIPPVLLNSDWFSCKIFGDRIIISFVIFGSEGLVLFFLINLRIDVGKDEIEPE